jgi:hypothetical protein
MKWVRLPDGELGCFGSRMANLDVQNSSPIVHARCKIIFKDVVHLVHMADDFTIAKPCDSDRKTLGPVLYS